MVQKLFIEIENYIYHFHVEKKFQKYPQENASTQDSQTL